MKYVVTKQLDKPIYERFCQAYVNEAEGNAAEAYRLAGFKPDSANKSASRLLQRPEIRARIDCLISEKNRHNLLEYYHYKAKNIKRLDAIADDEKINAMARISAIRELNEMLGFHAPIRQELTGAEGKPLIQSEEELEARCKELQRKLALCKD